MPLVHPQFNPIAIELGPLAIRWYGLMYLLGFVILWLLGRYRIKHQPWVGFSAKELDDIIFYGVLGVILGGRLGYVLFYKPAYYFANPLEIFSVWQGGMSFHGGFLGVLVAMALFARRHKKDWFTIMDFVAPLVAPGLALGRLGNFINGELPGRATDLPWGMIFPQVDNVVRHPSQLYQLAMEGVLLFIIVWIYSLKPRPRGAVAGLFSLGYGVFRFIVEYFRAPDDFLGLLTMGLSMGQWLSLPMIVVGLALIVWAYRKQPTIPDAPRKTS
ncbi:MAG: prolipoprotein diacylglyceryl transferase [Burkholderiales bacterium]|nr:prolipoprotein diacylglyceryl transferase [Burkholderiales bacterium]